jgi:transcriptional regulator with XRE-family HTH domain
VKADKNHRAQMRRLRKMLQVKQDELATLAGLSSKTVARYERGKHVSLTTEALIGDALIRMIAKKNPESVKLAAQPVLETADKCDRIISLESGSQSALELERLTGKSLSQLKIEAETLPPFLRGVGNSVVSLTE